MPRILCRGLLIDMDGVLVDSTAAIARVWARWAARHNMDPIAVTALAHGRTSRASIKDLLPHETAEVHDEEDRWMLRAEIEDVADVVALPGARELLASVPSDHRAVVTSAARNLAEIRLRAAGVWDLVHHLVTSSDVRNGKPNPEPYLKGAVEETLLFRWMGLDCRSTPDVRGADFVTELKTAPSADPAQFGWHALRMHYHAQMRMEQMGAVLGLESTILDCFIVCVEANEPHPVTVFRVDEKALEVGEKLLCLWAERLKVAEASQAWPPYVSCVVPLTVPEEEPELIFGDDNV